MNEYIRIKSIARAVWFYILLYGSDEYSTKSARHCCLKLQRITHTKDIQGAKKKKSLHRNLLTEEEKHHPSIKILNLAFSGINISSQVDILLNT